MKHVLIVQGGGFRTAFSAGVLDAFMKNGYNPFDGYIAVSGGAIATSYYLSEQPEHCIRSIHFLSEKGRFVNYSNIFRKKPIMDVDIFIDIANVYFPFDDEKAHKNLCEKKFMIVMTDKKSGAPYYCDPTKTNWREAVMASCSLPFITKGGQTLEGNLFMDGAWGDPLPVEWATAQGAKEIIIIRTAPHDEKISKSWIDFIGEMYYLKNENMKKAFRKNHEKYNRAVDFINNPPQGVTVRQIAPQETLKAGEFTKSKQLLDKDYQHGLKQGNLFLEKVLI